jgi:multiple sugar transport system substrate-binding protein
MPRLTRRARRQASRFINNIVDNPNAHPYDASRPAKPNRQSRRYKRPTSNPEGAIVMVRSRMPGFVAAVVLSVFALVVASTATAQTKLTLWSHWADQESKVAFVNEAVKRFEAKNPGVKVEVTWYQKPALYAALKTALRARQAPDIFYAENDQTEYIDNGFLYDLSKELNWTAIEPWAKQAWTFGNGTYGFPLEAWTVEVYYNRALMKKIGATIPVNGALTQDQFLDMIKKASAAGITPMVQGVGDRPYPGAFLVHEPLLRKLGKDDYMKLLKGQLSWKDPRVIETLNYVKQIVDAGALPKGYTSIKMGEAHYYFHTSPGGLTFPMGSFYPSRAFNPTDKGGEPPNFPLGIMSFPAMDGGKCNNCKTLAAGGSYVVNAASKNPKLAVALLNEMATPEMGARWAKETLVQTGIKTDMSSIQGEHADYFKMLSDASKGTDYFVGLPSQVLQGQAKEVFAQVMNTAFPAGLISVKDATEQMDAAMKAGK